MIAIPRRTRTVRDALVLMLGWATYGCLLDNTDKADAGANNSGGSTVSNLCVSQLSPCGGDVSGTWGIQSICAVSAPIDVVNANFSKYPNCAGVCTAATVTASGTKTYDSGTLTTNEAFVLSETLGLTGACFGQVLGADLNDSTCQAASGQFASASCGLSVAGCSCQITETTQNQALSYAISGNSLTEAQLGSLQGTSIDYCVLGNTMTQRRTLPPGVDFIVTYTRR